MKTNIVIIGGGPGGYQTALYAASHGLKVVIAEERLLGGTCLNKGCIPTKSLLHDAAIAYKLPLKERVSSFNAAVKRKDEIVSTLRQRVIDMLQGNDNITLENGHAFLIDKGTVAIGEGKIYTPDNIIIATGSQSWIPPIPGIFSPSSEKLDYVVTPEEVLSLKVVPQRVCIVGAGVIGMEMATMFNAFGSKVTIIEAKPECLPNLDGDISRRIRKCMERKGIKFYLSCQVEKVDNHQIHFVERKRMQSLSAEADLILIATGRHPLVRDIGLDQAGVKIDHGAISVDNNMQTNIPGIYAIGDANGLQMLAHAATFQGRHVVNHLLGHGDSIRLDIMPAAIFTNPEAALVGRTEMDCKEKGIAYTCRKAVYRSNGRALSMDETEGIVKIICAQDDVHTILGCQAFGKDSSYLVQEIASLMNRNISLKELEDIVHIHPTLSELLLQTIEC